ncbi:MAG: S-layer homology domain-containing protein, partial [Oscillospiraceae bacterium]|nr:S-layer homology domain-containing protein [Oscillospiraceae bacterium]
MKKKLVSIMLVLILVMGLALPASAASFTDVAPGAWYEEAVNWAVENGITTGVGNGLFAP